MPTPTQPNAEQVPHTPPKAQKLVPWTYETCPLGAWVKAAIEDSTVGVMLITGKNTGAATCADALLSYATLHKYYLHSPDGGKSWSPCGTLTREQ